MTTLALEFSAAVRSVALARAGVVLATAQATGDRATNAFALIQDVLAAAAVRREDVEAIAVGLGPGSYTGIRVAVSLAQGWQLARPVKVMGVDAISTLAAQAQARGIFGRVNLVIDAQRGEYYLATWEISAAERREVLPLKIVPAAELTARAGEIFAGPDAPSPGGIILHPEAAMVARLAHGQPGSDTGAELLPVYLRESTFVKWQPPQTAAT